MIQGEGEKKGVGQMGESLMEKGIEPVVKKVSEWWNLKKKLKKDAGCYRGGIKEGSVRQQDMEREWR